VQAQLAQLSGVFTLILARVVGLTLTAPLFSWVVIPLAARLTLALMLALLIAPVYAQSAVPLPDAGRFALAMVREATLGATLGFAAALVLLGLRGSVQMLLQMAGLAPWEHDQETPDHSTAPIGQAVQMVAVAVLLLSGGHRLVIASLLNTFRRLPPGSGHDAPGTWQLLAELLAVSFAFGLRAIIPLACCVLIASLVVSVVTRTLPHVHTSVSAGVNLAVVLAALSLTLGTIGWLFQEQLALAMELTSGRIW
jgi:flagellar biosynthetic protein FliR